MTTTLLHTPADKLNAYVNSITAEIAARLVSYGLGKASQAREL